MTETDTIPRLCRFDSDRNLPILTRGKLDFHQHSIVRIAKSREVRQANVGVQKHRARPSGSADFVLPREGMTNWTVLLLETKPNDCEGAVRLGEYLVDALAGFTGIR